jgi:hypothetical protein
MRADVTPGIAIGAKAGASRMAVARQRAVRDPRHHEGEAEDEVAAPPGSRWFSPPRERSDSPG